jgi:hypothetical protein
MDDAQTQFGPMLCTFCACKWGIQSITGPKVCLGSIKMCMGITRYIYLLDMQMGSVGKEEEAHTTFVLPTIRTHSWFKVFQLPIVDVLVIVGSLCWRETTRTPLSGVLCPTIPSSPLCFVRQTNLVRISFTQPKHLHGVHGVDEGISPPSFCCFSSP